MSGFPNWNHLKKGSWFRNYQGLWVISSTCQETPTKLLVCCDWFLHWKTLDLTCQQPNTLKNTCLRLISGFGLLGPNRLDLTYHHQWCVWERYGHPFCSGESDWQVLSNQSMLPTCSFSTIWSCLIYFLCTLGFYLIVPAISLFFDALTQAALLLVSNRFVHCNLLITRPPSWTTGIPSYKSISSWYLAWLSCRLFQDTSCPVASKGGRRLA